jgi:hypothetical protein
LIADTFQSPVAYGIAAGIFFLVVVGGGLWLMSRAGRLQDQEEKLEDDPIITGERSGIGYMALQVVGGIIAIPFKLFEYTVKAFGGLAGLAHYKEAGASAEPEADQTRSNDPSLPAKTSGTE